MNDSDNSKVTKFEGKLVVIAGPTASGKTSVAINLAEKLNTVVVSADSRQFYKEIPIGTAAPDLSERRGIDHFFIGNLSIHDYYNVYIYSNEVIDLLDSRFWDKEYIVMAGGSGLYIDAVCKGIDELPDIDSKIREKIKDIYSNKGIDELIRILSDIDP